MIVLASACAPRWRRIIHKVAPFLFKQCPGKNYHWCWDRLCYCRVCEHDSDWEGGILDFKTGEELIPREYVESRVTEWKHRWLLEESPAYILDYEPMEVFVVATRPFPGMKDVVENKFYTDEDIAFRRRQELNDTVEDERFVVHRMFAKVEGLSERVEHSSEKLDASEWSIPFSLFVIAARPSVEKVVDERFFIDKQDAVTSCQQLNCQYPEAPFKVFEARMIVSLGEEG